MKKKILILISICLCIRVFAQSDQRIINIQNKIEILKVDIPGLEEKVNVNITNTTLSNFLLAVSQIHKVNINVDQDLKSIQIVNGFNDVNVADLIVFLAKEYDLNIDFTGNILSVSKYKKPEKKELPKEISASYNIDRQLLSLDLQNDPLDKVFRKIMDVSGKNLLFSPQLQSKKLSVYFNEVPFESALDKLSLANGLEFEKTEDGFYIFNSLNPVTSGGNSNFNQGSKQSSQRIRPRRKKGNFYYKILDFDAKTVAVDFEATPISDIIYTIAEELKLDIFTASPMENAGTATVKTENIHFDKLLTKIFESANATGGNSSGFTFKKDKNLYYFGTDQQLTLKQIERVTMMHRSVELLGDPASGQSFGNSRFSGNFNSSNGVNFFGNNGGGGLNNGGFQNTNGIQSQRNGGLSNNSSRRFGNNQNSNIGNNRSSDAFTGFNNNGNGNSSQSGGDISSLIPMDILEGLEIKIDTELNGFIISGPGTRVEKFKNFIHYIDKPIPVVLIEVMILEVNKNATVETGVDFGLSEEAVKDKGEAFPRTNLRLGAKTVNRIIGGFDGFGSLNLGNVQPNFYMNIKAMEANGNLKILSTPKLSTLNGHKAYLSSGQTTYFEVTNQNFFGSQIPQTSQVTNFQPIDAELALEFKPFVSGDGQITLDIQVVQSSFGNRISEDAPPDINSRRFSSIIRMQENDVAILGGLEEKFKNDSGSGVPLLSRIPIIKWLFSSRRREDRKMKLNILVKPTVFY